MGYSKAIELNPNYSLPYYRRAILLNNFGGEDNDYYSCISDLTRAIELKPDAPEYYSLRATCKSGLNDFNSAIQDISKAIKLDPSKADYWHSRGRYKKKLDDLYGAIADFSVAIEIDNNQYYHYLISRALVKHILKNDKGACDDLLKAYDMGYKINRWTTDEEKKLIQICN